MLLNIQQCAGRPHPPYVSAALLLRNLGPGHARKCRLLQELGFYSWCHGEPEKGNDEIKLVYQFLWLPRKAQPGVVAVEVA